MPILLTLPLPDDADPVALTTTVDGAEWHMSFTPDEVAGYWIFNLDVDGVATVRGAPLVYGTRLLGDNIAGNLMLVPQDINDRGVPSIDELPTRAYLVYRKD